MSADGSTRLTLSATKSGGALAAAIRALNALAASNSCSVRRIVLAAIGESIYESEAAWHRVKACPKDSRSPTVLLERKRSLDPGCRIHRNQRLSTSLRGSLS